MNRYRIIWCLGCITKYEDFNEVAHEGLADCEAIEVEMPDNPTMDVRDSDEEPSDFVHWEA